MSNFNSDYFINDIIKNISSFFDDFEKMIFHKSISSSIIFDYKTKIDKDMLNLSKNLTNKTLNDLSFNEYKRYISKFILKIKCGCNDVNNKFSSELIVNNYSLELFMSFFEKQLKISKIIDIIFKTILQEGNNNDFKKYIYKSFIENVYIKNSTHLIGNIFSLINKIRNEIKHDDLYLNISDDTTFENLSDKLQNFTYTIKTFFQTLSELESLTNNEIILSNIFNDIYCNELTKMYSVFNSLILSLDDSDFKSKMNNLKMLIVVETSIHENLFTNNEQYMDIFSKEILAKNIDFIIEYIKSRLIFIDDKFLDIIDESKQSYISINKILNTLTDIPNFITIYYKLFNYSIKSVETICTLIGNHIAKIIGTCPKDQYSIKMIFMTLNLLNKLEDNLSYKFLPMHSLTKFNENRINNQVISNLMCNNIHNSLSNIIKTISHDTINKFIFTICNKKENIREKDLEFNNLTLFFKDAIIEEYNEIIQYIIYCVENKDELETIFKKNLMKKMIYNDISNINLEKLKYIIAGISNLDDICLNSCRKIIIEYEKGLMLSIEYNNLFFDKQKYLNLTYLTDGLCEIKNYEYDLDNFISTSFKNYLSQLKQNFNIFHSCKFESRKSLFIENLSTFELVYNIKNFALKFITNYKQTDILFLIQNEYNDEISKLKSLTNICDDNLNLFNKLNNTIKSDSFVKWLIKKDIFKISNITIKNTQLDFVEFNDNYQVNKNKILECYKLNKKKVNTKNNEASDKNKSNIDDSSLVFYRSDYIKAFIVKYCKINRDKAILDDLLFTETKNNLKNRFNLDKSLYQTTVNKLVDNEYLQKITNNNEISYEYIP